MRFNIVILVFMSFIIAMTPALDKKKKILEDTENLLKEIFKTVESININKWAKGHSAYYME